MKPINFISPIPEHKKKEVRRWILLTGLASVGLIIFISISLFERCYHYYLLRSQRIHAEKDHMQCSLILQTQKEKEQTHTTTAQQIAKMKQYHNQPNHSATILKTCAQKITTSALQSCTIGQHVFELSYTSSNIAQAQHALKQIATISALSNPQLISLQRQNNAVISTIKAEINRG